MHVLGRHGESDVYYDHAHITGCEVSCVSIVTAVLFIIYRYNDVRVICKLKHTIQKVSFTIILFIFDNFIKESKSCKSYHYNLQGITYYPYSNYHHGSIYFR